MSSDTPDALRNKSVLISGMGIAGPALAYWLTVHGFKTTLVEIAPHLRTGGYVIDFWGRGFDVAEKMGILPEIKREGYDVKELRLVNSHGQRVGGFNVEFFRSATNGRYVSIARGELAKIIYQKIEGRCETLFDDGIRKIEQDEDGVRVAFERSAPRRFGIVIGADGLHSVVRKLVFGKQAFFEKYLGYKVAAFTANGYRPRDEDVFVSYSLPGKQVARFAMRDDRTMFLFVFADAKSRYDEQPGIDRKDILRAEFGEAGWECPQILEAMESCGDIYFDRVSQIRMETWSQGRVSLVGDAAFCPSLLAGQGSALAIIGAYVLAGELSRTASRPNKAFQRYEQQLRPFIASKQDAAVRLSGSFAPKTRFGIFLRNQITETFKLPFVAELAMGPSLLDRIDLPDYPVSVDLGTGIR
ncbi:MAG TPA: FAD-binding domain [Chthoniobacterales bacterium]|nr:FAD-binding domain [Chthoniobacterales bacterium]